MGHLVYFPTERYGGVTQSTEAPHAIQRLCNVALARIGAIPGVDGAIEDYCQSIGLSESQLMRCKRMARNAINANESRAEAIRLGKNVAKWIKWGRHAPAVGFVPKDAA